MIILSAMKCAQCICMFLSDNLERVDRAQCICMFLSDNLERDELRSMYLYVFE